MKLLLVIVKLAVYTVLTYLIMLVITALHPTNENSSKNEQSIEISVNQPKSKLRTILKAPEKVAVNINVPSSVNLSCLKENGSLVTVVKSKIDHFERRKDIRWGLSVPESYIFHALVNYWLFWKCPFQKELDFALWYAFLYTLFALARSIPTREILGLVFCCCFV